MSRLEGLHELSIKLKENIESLIEFRDNAIHFVNMKYLSKPLQELGFACIKNYVQVIKDWQTKRSLSKYNLYLMPLAYVENKDVIKENSHVVKVPEDVVKEKGNVTKEFIKAQRQFYKLISQMPQINATQMSENMGFSLRQVQRYLKQLSDLNLIVREGGRKNGIWKIVDEEYEGFFNRI